MRRGPMALRTSDRVWRPDPEWVGMPVLVVGTGPSFTIVQAKAIEAARARDAIRVIAVNDAVKQVPHADIVFASDRKWWKARDHLPDFAGRRVGLAESYFDAPENVLLLRRAGCEGCELTPGLVHTHGHSGAMATQLAAQLGAAPIVLVGFDMRRGLNGRRHFFGDYEGSLGSKPDMAVWRERFKTIASALEGRLLNGTGLDSALDFVPPIDLIKFLTGDTCLGRSALSTSGVTMGANSADTALGERPAPQI